MLREPHENEEKFPLEWFLNLNPLDVPTKHIK